METRKEELIWSGLFLALLGMAALFYAAAERAEEKYASLLTENEAAEIFAAHAEKKKASALFSRGEDALREAAEAAGQSGVVLEGVSEELPEETEHGKILKMKIKGSGSFSQVLSLFDIIHMKKHWMAAELRRIENRDGTLRFEMELAVYQGKTADRETR